MRSKVAFAAALVLLAGAPAARSATLGVTYDLGLGGTTGSINGQPQNIVGGSMTVQYSAVGTMSPGTLVTGPASISALNVSIGTLNFTYLGDIFLGNAPTLNLVWQTGIPGTNTAGGFVLASGAASINIPPPGVLCIGGTCPAFFTVLSGNVAAFNLFSGVGGLGSIGGALNGTVLIPQTPYGGTAVSRVPFTFQIAGVETDRTFDPDPPGGVIPEPGAAMLFGLSALLLGLRRVARRRG